MAIIRPNIAAGVHYPTDKDQLFADVDNYLNRYDDQQLSTMLGRPVSDITVKALIMPHSSYQYVGDLYGIGYNLLRKQTFDEVFMLGVSHFSKFEGCAVADYQKWETPIGYLEQSHRTTQIISSDNLKKKDILLVNNRVHTGEHSIEVHLPFLRYISHGATRIVPAILGDVSPRLLGSYLDELVDRDDVIIGSAEFSVGYPKDYAEVIDATAIDAILDLDNDRILSEKYQSTGANVIATIVEIAKARDWHVSLMKYQNSAEVDQLPDRTTGRAVIVFYE